VVPRGHLAGDIVLDVDVDVLWRLAAAQPLGRLLNAELLGVDELGLVVVDAERPLSFTALALVRFLEVPAFLWDARQRATALALEGGVRNLRPDVGGLADDTLDSDEVAAVVRPDVADAGRFRQARDAHVGLSERDVDRQVVEAQRFLGVLDELGGLVPEVVGEVRVEAIEVLPVDVQRLLFVGILLGEFGNLVAVVTPVELLECVDQFGVVRTGHLVMPR